MTEAQSPIAVFDSGLGGLTVVRAIRKALPAEDLIYFGDTARVPYGSKSPETVTGFALEICEFLSHFKPKCLVAACSTVSATALPRLRAELDTPIIGVVDPCASQAARLTRRNLVAVLGTEATVASGAYERCIRSYDPRIRVVQQSCPLLVPVIEEGRRQDDEITRMILGDYLEPLKRLHPDVVLLGCTHYPLLRSALTSFFGNEVHLLDSGEAVSAAVKDVLSAARLLSVPDRPGRVLCYVSDLPQRFSEIATRFLGEPLPQVLRASVDSWKLPNEPVRAASA